MSSIRDRETIRRIINQYHRKTGGLLAILHEIQRIYGYLPQDILKLTADAMDRSLVDIYAVASFSGDFTLGPPAEDVIPAGASPPARAYRATVRCHRCNHSLLDPEHRIGGSPSMRVTVAFGMEHGWFRFASLPGVYGIASEYPLPSAGEVSFFCPHCHTELFVADNCEACGAPLVPMLDTDGVMSTICSNRACRFQQCRAQAAS